MQRKKIENHCVRYSSLLVIAPKVNISLYISKRHVFMNSKKKFTNEFSNSSTACAMSEFRLIKICVHDQI